LIGPTPATGRGCKWAFGGEKLADGALGILERSICGMPGRVVARAAAQTFRLDAAADVVDVHLRRNLECQSATARVLATFELNHQSPSLVAR